MTFISQKQAIGRLRAATNLSRATCEKAVKKMPTRADGKRAKVHILTVQELIASTNDIRRQAATIPSRSGRQGLSPRTRARIRTEI